MSKKKKKEKSYLEIYQSIRREWTVNPVTKIIPDKRRKKPKHKGREGEE